MISSDFELGSVGLLCTFQEQLGRVDGPIDNIGNFNDTHAVQIPER